MSGFYIKFIIFIFIIIKFIFLIQFCSEFHLLQNSDTLLHSIISTQEVTPYYWGQDQWLNFIPFIFSFVQDTELNLILITLLQFLIFFSLPFTFLKLYGIKNTYLTSILFYIIILLPTSRLYHISIITESYIIAISLSFINLLIIKTKLKSDFKLYIKNTISIIIFCISFKICQPVIFLYAFHYLFYYIKEFSEFYLKDIIIFLTKKIFSKEFLMFFLLVLTTFYCIQDLHNFKSIGEVIQYRKMNIILSPGYAFKSVINLFDNYDTIYDKNKIHFIVSIISFLIFFLKIKKRVKCNSKPLIILLFSSVTNIILFSVLEWTELNSYHPRYILFSSVLLCLFSSVTISSIISHSLSKGYIYYISLFLLVICLLLTLITHNPTKPLSVTKRLKTEFFNKSRITIDSKEVHGAIGDYWSVWPAVWINNAYGRRDYFGVSVLRTRVSLIKRKKTLLLRHYGTNNELKHIIGRYFPKSNYSMLKIDDLSYVKVEQ